MAPSDPIPFAIIGTNWITHDFVSHAHATGKWRLAAVYSRKQETAQEFASRYTPSPSQNINLYTELAALASDGSITTVYIASPNILHHAHAKQMLLAGKHVVLEKPACPTVAQLNELFGIAYERGLILVEAFRHLHERHYKSLKSQIQPEAAAQDNSNNNNKVGKVLGASLSYCQFSSRYDAVLKGETPNVFNLEFGGGALADLGVYTISAAVDLFGAPDGATYYPVLTRTGADGGGTVVLRYKKDTHDAFSVNCVFSKMWASRAGQTCEVWGERGTLSWPTITDIEGWEVWDPRKKEVAAKSEGEKESMNLKEEADEFARIVAEKDVESMKRWEQVSRGVVGVTEKVRRENGLFFKGEEMGPVVFRGTGEPVMIHLH